MGESGDRTQSVRFKEVGSDLRLGFEEGMGVCPGEEDGKGQSQLTKQRQGREKGPPHHGPRSSKDPCED